MKTSSPSPRTQINRLKKLHEEQLLNLADYHAMQCEKRLTEQRNFFELELASRDTRITDLLIQIEERKDPEPKPSLWASVKGWAKTIRWVFRNP